MELPVRVVWHQSEIAATDDQACAVNVVVDRMECGRQSLGCNGRSDLKPR